MAHDSIPVIPPSPPPDVWEKLLKYIERNEHKWNQCVPGKLDFGGGFGDLVWVREEEPRISLACLFGDNWVHCGMMGSDRAEALANSLSFGKVKRAKAAAELIRAKIATLEGCCDAPHSCPDCRPIRYLPALRGALVRGVRPARRGKHVRVGITGNTLTIPFS